MSKRAAMMARANKSILVASSHAHAPSHRAATIDPRLLPGLMPPRLFDSQPCKGAQKRAAVAI